MTTTLDHTDVDSERFSGPDDDSSGIPAEREPDAGPELYTITAGGFSATADAFARDPDTEGLWFLSMVGSQTALKAIWASLLKQPPEPAHLVRGADGMILSGSYLRCADHRDVDDEDRPTAGVRRLARPGLQPEGRSTHSNTTPSSLLAQSEDDAPELHHRFLDRGAHCPCTAPGRSGSGKRGLETGETAPLQSVGVTAYRCSPDGKTLREDLSPGGCVGQAAAARRRAGHGG